MRALRVRRTGLLLLAAVLLWPLGAPAPAQQAGAPVAPAPTRCADPDAVSRVGHWERLRAPRFREHPGGRGQELLAFAVHPRRPQVRFATNGTSVERSDDGGCTWREVYALPAVPTEEDTLSAATSEVQELVIPVDDRATDRLVLLLRDGGGGPRVLVSADGGREEPFRDRSEGLPPAGTPTDLLVAATNPEIMYLGVRTAPRPDDEAPGLVPDLPLPPPLGGGDDGETSAGGGLWATDDGGLTWEMRLDPQDVEGSTRPVDLLAGHPTSPNRLWAVGDGVVRASTDGGRTWRGPAPSEQEQRERGWQVTALAADALSASAGSGAGVVVLLAMSATSSTGGPVALASADGGATFGERPAPGVADAVSPFLPGSGAFAVSTRAAEEAPARVSLVSLRRGRATQSIDISPEADAASYAAQADRSSTPTVHARTPTALLRYVGPHAVLPPRLPPVVGGSVHDGVPPLGPAALTPSHLAVELPLGEERTVEHVLRTPRRPTPLDLYVLLDTSESMADDIDAVRRDLVQLVERLRATGTDVSVGLGEFKGDESSVAYRRVVGVGPDVARFRAGLSRLVADGYGLEAQLIALEQALTGAGEQPVDLVPPQCELTEADPDRAVQSEQRSAPPVVAGQQADFRRSAVPVVLVVTDTNFLRPAGTRLKDDCTVDVEGVAADYARAGVHVVGLGIDDIDDPRRAADLTALARATGALQPPGRSCAPSIDPRPRAAAVCRAAVDLVPSLVALAAQQREPAEVELVLSGDTAALRVASPVVRAVDLRRPAELVLPVTYSCAGARPGVRAAGLDVRLAGVTLASLDARVTCVAAPATAGLPPAAARPPQLAPALPPPGAPPPPPPAQAVQPQVQTQPQANPQVQAGTQDQEQGQAALAVAHQEAERSQVEGERSFAMSALPERRDRDAPAAAWLAGVALTTGLATSVALAKQRGAVRAATTRQ